MDQFLAQALRVVGPREGDAQKRQLVAGEDLVDEAVALNPVRAGVGAVVQLDAAQDPAGGGVGDDEVDVFARDFVEGALPAGALRGIE